MSICLPVAVLLLFVLPIGWNSAKMELRVLVVVTALLSIFGLYKAGRILIRETADEVRHMDLDIRKIKKLIAARALLVCMVAGCILLFYIFPDDMTIGDSPMTIRIAGIGIFVLLFLLFFLLDKTEKEFDKLLPEETSEEDTEEFGLDDKKVIHYTELLKSFSRDAIQISLAQDDNAPLPTGCSKYGGRPDVADDFQWPHDNSGYPLSLLLQIDCADLAFLDREGLLPTSGHLYFFYELSQMDWDGTDNDVRVLYNGLPSSQLHPLDFPENLADEYQLKEWPLQFTHGSSIPTIEELSQLTDEPFNEEDEDERYEAFDRLWKESLIGIGSIGSMLGFAFLIQDPIVDDLLSEVLLLQLDSNGEYWREDDETPHDLLFGDDGCIYFYIKREDLQARRFDRITFALQCY